MHLCSRSRVRIPLFSAVLPHFSAKLTIFFRKPECAHFGRFISRFGVYNSAVEGAMTRPVHVRFFGGRRFSTRCTTWAGPQSRSQRLDLIIQLSSNSFKFLFHSSASMPARPEEALDQARPYEQKGLLGPDGNWLSKRARQNQAGSTSVASPVQSQKFDGLTGNRLRACRR